MPKIINQKDVRLDIVKKSFSVFASNGYFNTSVNHISAASGLNRTALYYYFKNKFEVYQAIFDYVIDTIENDLLQAIKFDISSEDKINYISNKWEKQFGNRNLTMYSLELHLLVLRGIEDFKDIKTKLDKVNKYVLQKYISHIKNIIDSDLYTNPIMRFLDSVSKTLDHNNQIYNIS